MANAVILAAGRGTRMGDLTSELPKPMLPLGGKPLLEHVLNRLRAAGFHRALIVTGYRAELVEEHFRRYPLEIEFRRQHPVDGTGSATRLAESFTGDAPFLLTYGDILAAPEDFAGVYRKLVDTPDAQAALGAKWVDDPWQGAAIYTAGERVVRIVEKPAPGSSTTHWNSAGINAFQPLIFGELARIGKSPRGEYEITEAIVRLLDAGHLVMLHPLAGAWKDVGRPDDLAAAQELI